MLVSVIIPVYNVEKYIDECIQSVLNQSYTNIEIILVDDGSTDFSGDICDAYKEKDNRIVVIHKENGGLSHARNAGLKVSNGEYVYFLDSDDYIEKNTIESLLMEAEYRNADLVFFDSLVVNENDSDSYPDNYYIRKGLYSNPLKGYKMAEDLIKHREFFSSVPLLFLKRSLIFSNNLKFMDGILHEDELFTFEAFMKSECAVHVSVPFYYRRVRDFSIMTKKVSTKNYYGLRAIFDKLEEYYCSEIDFEKKNVIKMEQVIIFNAIYRKYLNLSLKEQRTLIKDILNFKIKMSDKNWLDDKSIKFQCKHLLLNKILNNFIVKRIWCRIEEQISRIKEMRENTYIIHKLKNPNVLKGKILLIGVPTHGNLGDHAIAEAEKRFFNKNFPQYDLVEIPTVAYKCLASKIKKNCRKEDIVIVSGGGWLGDLWLHNEVMVRDIVKKFHNNPLIVMPQTVYFSDSKNGYEELKKSREIFNKHKKLVMFLRDKNSYDFALENKYVENAFYFPDMVLYGINDKAVYGEERNGCLMCFRKDRERTQNAFEVFELYEDLKNKYSKTEWTTTVYLDDIELKNRLDSLNKKLIEYSKAEIVVTDRLHSMIFAAITGTPCVAVDNLTKKVGGVYNWIEKLPYIITVNSVKEVVQAINKIDLNKKYSYQFELLLDDFCEMKRIIQEHIELDFRR